MFSFIKKYGFSDDTPKFINNTTILFVDDDDDILNTYKMLFSSKEKEESKLDALFHKRRKNRKKSMKKNYAESNEKSNYFSGHNFRVLTASSGEAAIDIVKNEVAAGKSIAAGFFDMNMPGGIDGLETIKKIKKLDPYILCAVVTAYTDRSIFQIGKLFKEKDEWIYFSKPFSLQELEQAAIHLVNSWNRRYRESQHLEIIERSQQGLQYIFHALLQISKIPPLAIKPLLKGILDQITGLVGTTSGVMFLFNKNMNIILKTGTGKFFSISDENLKNIIDTQRVINESIEGKAIAYYGTTYSVPLIIDEKVIGIIYLENSSDSIPHLNLLRLFRVQLANILENSKLYEDLLITNNKLKNKINKLP